MDVTTNHQKLPKYIYTPDYERAFLTISADIHGNWSAGYFVWQGASVEFEGAEIARHYGPYINDARDVDQAIVQLYNLYVLWQEGKR